MEPTKTGKPLVNVDGQEIDPMVFADYLAELPMLNLELSEALVGAVAATQLHGLKSTVALTVSIAKGDSHFNELLVTTKIVSKPGTPTAPVQPMFPSDAGGLSKRSKDQPQIPGTETT